MNQLERLLENNNERFKNELTALEHQYCQNIQKLANEYIERAKQIRIESEQQPRLLQAFNNNINHPKSFNPKQITVKSCNLIHNENIESISHVSSGINRTETANNSTKMKTATDMDSSPMLENSGTTPYHIQKIRASLQRGQQLYLDKQKSKRTNDNSININDNNNNSNVNRNENINVSNFQSVEPINMSENKNGKDTTNTSYTLTSNDTLNTSLDSSNNNDTASVSNVSNHSGNLIKLQMDIMEHFNDNNGKGLSMSDLESINNRKNTNNNSNACSETLSTESSQYQSLNSSLISDNNTNNTNNKSKKRRLDELDNDCQRIKQMTLKNQNMLQSYHSTSSHINNNDSMIQRQNKRRKLNPNCDNTSNLNTLEFGKYYQKFERSINNLHCLKSNQNSDRKSNKNHDSDDNYMCDMKNRDNHQRSTSEHRGIRCKYRKNLRDIEKQMNNMQSIKLNVTNCNSQIRSKSMENDRKKYFQSSHAQSLKQLRQQLQKTNYLLKNDKSLHHLSII